AGGVDAVVLSANSNQIARPDQLTRILAESSRYISTTLAAYVGETVTLRFDPRDMAEIRLFHNDKFLCSAICPELAGATVPLREILRARNRRRRELRGVLRDRQSAVDTLLEMKRGELREKDNAPPAPTEGPAATKQSAPALKRYRNE
ncbi:MAG TPA: Mu transposase C-terminal domain-containing protein, partial [Bryobacteraceae bacterium]|nr:Mu transposase C-terminal domain-containing protein [Bryobacteraceae bacterium]